MRLFVVIASYGNKNLPYLERVLAEYRSMTFEAHIVVLSNLDKSLGSDIELLLHQPTGHPWTFPFVHRQILADRLPDYDLFIYSEDDMLITERNIRAFLEVNRSMSQDEVPGLFQREFYPDGTDFFPAVHSHFHWDTASVTRAGPYTFARFTNDHSACYLLTREQLQQAIASGGFLVKPHEHQYDLLVTAATDPYTQCGMRRLICISHLQEFLVSHLPNRYIGTTMGLDGRDFYPQVRCLLESEVQDYSTRPPFAPETTTFHRYWSKSYYEAARHDLISLFPSTTRSILSVGCGWGATEECILKRGIQTLAVPLDPAIARCAEMRGIPTAANTFSGAWKMLSGQSFDGVLISGLLHLHPDPIELVYRAASLLCPGGVLVMTIPDLNRIPTRLRWLWQPTRYTGVGKHCSSGIHIINRRRAKQLCIAAGLEPELTANFLPDRFKRASIARFQVGAQLLASEYAIVAKKAS